MHNTLLQEASDSLQPDSHECCLLLTVLHGSVNGGRRQDRQRKRLEDSIREWTGLEFAKSQRAVENRGKWRKLVAKIICGALTTPVVKG